MARTGFADTVLGRGDIDEGKTSLVQAHVSMVRVTGAFRFERLDGHRKAHVERGAH